MSESIKENDEELLGYVYDIRSEKTDNPQTLSVTLYFRENPFMENTEIYLKAFMKSDDEVDKTEATEIKWKEGKDLTKKKIKKKQKHKKTGEMRQIVKTVDTDSFFTIFKSRAMPDDADSDEEHETMDKLDE